MYESFESDPTLFDNSISFFIKTNDLVHLLESIKQKHINEINDRLDYETKRNDLIIWNAVLCRQVIEKGISKSYLHTLYNKYYKLITSTSSLANLQQLEIELATSYFHIMINDMEVTENYIVNKILTYLHLHIEEHISIQKIADDLNISEGYACSCFKKNMNITLMNYAKMIKIDRGKKLLMTTDVSILELAGILGFYDTSHFTRTFKSFTGMTPTEYRNKYFFEK